MTRKAIIALGLSVAVLGGAVAGTTDTAKIAATQFDKARANLAAGRPRAAVQSAETAVAYDPQVAAYRVLLGQAYLKAGRFGSARSAFADALTLDPANGKAALHLALAEIAEGNWDGARRTLDANASIIAVSDRGLAVALAGDPAAAVELLDGAARAPDADAKTRQNLALALALAGRWSDARTVVAMDVAPDQVEARMTQWAKFAKPTSASDQVASLLGVTPVADPGQPVRLALNVDRNVGLAAAAPVDAFMPKAQPEAVAIAAEQGMPVESQAIAASVSNVSFAPRQEVVQTLPVRAVRSVPSNAVVAPGSIAAKPRSAVAVRPTGVPGAATASRTPAKGNFFVQLGAFDNAAVARDSWARIARTNPGFAGQRPSGMAISTKAGNFYRLSVGGFARGDADALCRGYRAKGGACFVRTGAGDRIAAWISPGIKLAAR